MQVCCYDNKHLIMHKMVIRGVKRVLKPNIHKMVIRGFKWVKVMQLKFGK